MIAAHVAPVPIPVPTPRAPLAAAGPLQVRMSVELGAGRRDLLLDTRTIALDGLELRCDVPLAARQLVRLRIATPPDGGVVTLTAMTRPARTPGVLGVELYGNSGPPLERWIALVQSVRSTFPDAGDRPLVAERPAGAAATTPWIRYLPLVELRFATEIRLLQSFAAIIAGAIVVKTARPLPAGQEVRVDLVHPVTGTTIEWKAIVGHTLPHGVELRLQGDGPQRRRELEAMCSDGLPELGGADVLSEE